MKRLAMLPLVLAVTGCASLDPGAPPAPIVDPVILDRAACLNQIALPGVPELTDNIYIKIEGNVWSVDQGGEWLLKVYADIRECLARSKSA